MVILFSYPSRHMPGYGIETFVHNLDFFTHECLALDEGFGTGDNDFFEKAEKMNDFIDKAGTLVLRVTLKNF